MTDAHRQSFLKHALLLALLSSTVLSAAWGGTKADDPLAVRLRPADKGLLRLEIRNESGKPMAFQFDLGGASQGMFLNFPQTADFEFRTVEGKVIWNEKRQETWFAPSNLNSVINQPVFRKAGPDGDQVNLAPIKLASVTLAPGGAITREFNPREVRQLLRLHPPYQQASEYRVRLNLIFVRDGVLFRRAPETGWIKF